MVISESKDTSTTKPTLPCERLHRASIARIQIIVGTLCMGLYNSSFILLSIAMDTVIDVGAQYPIQGNNHITNRNMKTYKNHQNVINKQFV